MREALDREDEGRVYSALLKIKNSKPEEFYGQNLDEILAPEFRLRKLTKDESNFDQDNELIIGFYRDNPEFFGFKSHDEFSYIEWIISDAGVDLCEMLEALPEGVETLDIGGEEMDTGLLISLVERGQKRYADYSDQVSEYGRCLGGAPRIRDVAAIVNSKGLTQMPEDWDGRALAKRLRIIARQNEVK